MDATIKKIGWSESWSKLVKILNSAPPTFNINLSSESNSLKQSSTYLRKFLYKLLFFLFSTKEFIN